MENETFFVRRQKPGDVRQRLGGAAAVTTNKAPLRRDIRLGSHDC